MARMTSFGVRQWLKAMDALPKTVTDLYLFGCPTFFVDQLNMVLNFGGAAKVLDWRLFRKILLQEVDGSWAPLFS